MRRSSSTLTGVTVAALAALAVAVPALATPSARSAVTPKLSFRSDGKGWYTVTTTPPSRLRAALISSYGCDFSGQHCQGSDVLDVEYLPKAAKHRVSWGIASFWQQPAADSEGGLYPGRYKIILSIPGTRVSQSTEFTLSSGG